MKNLFVCLLVCLFAGLANAGAILQATSATTNMGFYNSNNAWAVDNAINQSGLSSGYVSGATDFDLYIASNPTQSVASGDTWFSTSGIHTGNFDLALGGLFSIQSLALWNESQGAGQGVNSFNLLADVNSDFSTSTLLGNFSAFEGTTNAQVFEFSSVVASYVRLEILSNHGAGCCTGIMEIALEGGMRPSQVPEPASIALLGLGLFGIGFTRKNKTA